MDRLMIVAVVLESEFDSDFSSTAVCTGLLGFVDLPSLVTLLFLCKPDSASGTRYLSKFKILVLDRYVD